MARFLLGFVFCVFCVLPGCFALASEEIEAYKAIFEALTDEQKEQVLTAVAQFQSSATLTCDEFFCKDPDCGK